MNNNKDCRVGQLTREPVAWYDGQVKASVPLRVFCFKEARLAVFVSLYNSSERWQMVFLSLYLLTPGRPREDLDRWELCCRRNSGERSCLTIVTIVKLHEKIKRICTQDLIWVWPVLSLRGRSWGLWPMISFTRCSRPWFHTNIASVEVLWERRNKKLTKRTFFFVLFFCWWFENLMAGRHQDCDALILLVDLPYKSNYVKWFKWISQILMNSSP